MRPARFYFGTEKTPYAYFRKAWVVVARARQATEPVQLHQHDGRTWWWFQDETYVESEGLSGEDVKALALQMRQGKEATLARAHAEMRGEAQAARPRKPIPEAVRHEVWRRDQGRCVDCGSRERREFDHIVPWSQGGSNTARNLELRCEPCNKRKADAI